MRCGSWEVNRNEGIAGEKECKLQERMKMEHVAVAVNKEAGVAVVVEQADGIYDGGVVELVGEDGEGRGVIWMGRQEGGDACEGGDEGHVGGVASGAEEAVVLGLEAGEGSFERRVVGSVAADEGGASGAHAVEGGGAGGGATHGGMRAEGQIIVAGEEEQGCVGGLGCSGCVEVGGLGCSGCVEVGEPAVEDGAGHGELHGGAVAGARAGIISIRCIIRCIIMISVIRLRGGGGGEGDGARRSEEALRRQLGQGGRHPRLPLRHATYSRSSQPTHEPNIL